MAKIEVNKDAISTIKQALRQLATNGVPVGNMIEAVKDIEEKYAESEDERVKRILHSISSKMGFHLRDIFTEEEFQCFDAWSNAWLEKKGEQILANSAKTCKNEQKPTEKQGKHDMGISEATKQKLEDNLNKALEKETPESLSEFLDEQKLDWSEEDEKMINFIVKLLPAQPLACKWLKSLKDRVQPKIEWSEKDEENIDTISKALVRYISYDGITQGEERRLNIWLKSLKDRYTWKPSDEQMKAMQKALVDLCGKDEHNIITGLYYDLKKLKE